MAAITPIAMLFVPSESGVSHNAAESTAPADLIAGAGALAGVVAALDRRP
jgi:N-carbamoyl-L-amino-acid hydrolase